MAKKTISLMMSLKKTETQNQKFFFIADSKSSWLF